VLRMRDVLGVANLRKALASRYFFDNWFILLIKYMMTRLGFDVKLIARVDDCVIEVSPEVFGRLISRFYRGLIRPFKCVNGKLYINDIRIPFDRIDRVDDIQALSSGWFYDISCKCWKKNNVKFKRMYHSIFEIFEYGDYDALNVSGRDVVDVGAFIGDSSIYFALKGAKRVIAIEPHPGAYAEMLENIRLNNLEGVIVPLNAGLASKPGKIRVERVNEEEATGTFHRFSEAGEVDAVTLGEIVERYSIGEGAVLKMDCEGCEYDVILNDYEHVRLFDEILFEYHAYITKIPVQVLLEKLSRDFDCEIVSSEEFYRRHGLGKGQLGLVRCIKKRLRAAT
jgi:FkbM family methyltransferase